MNQKQRDFCQLLGVEVPLICGAMYPCSNPELVAAASEAGALGVVQPISLTYVHGYDYRKGLRYLRTLTQKPIAVNLLIEKSSQIYLDRMAKILEISLEEGIKFFVTALGNPKWVVEKVHLAGGKVFHDVTEKKWAQIALDAGVDGLICVNKNAGGHAGTLSPEELYHSLSDFKVPLICAGGVGSPEEFKKMLDLGYSAVQMGTRFLASKECQVSPDYKEAIVKAKASQIVLTDKLTGVPVAVIENEYVKRIGTRANFLVKLLLQNPKLKHWVRMFYSLKSAYGLKKSLDPKHAHDYYWQAGKSVENINSVESVADIVAAFRSEA